MSDYEPIITRAWDDAIRSTVEQVIRDAVGYGLNTEIQQVIKEKAQQLIDTDQELQAMILNALKSWITTQTADDFRKAREEAIRKYGARR